MTYAYGSNNSVTLLGIPLTWNLVTIVEMPVFFLCIIPCGYIHSFQDGCSIHKTLVEYPIDLRFRWSACSYLYSHSFI